MNTWLLRGVWLLLPVTAGDALAPALGGWSAAPRWIAYVLLWVLWAAVLSALLVPRPASMTIARLGTPIAFVVTVLVAFSSRPPSASVVLAIATSAVACALAQRGEFPRLCAQGAAYGDEERFPLKVPPGIAFVVLPIAVVIVGAGAAAGPLLLADARWVAGAVALVLGWPLAFLTVRLVHQLSRRWIVLVPAGLVVADPLTLTDPVLFVRERIQGVGPADPGRRPPPDALDLRLGAAYGSCALLLDEEADIMCRVRGRGVRTRAGLLLVTPGSVERMLERAGKRRIPVRRS
ncbi:MAG: hypothetical protein ACXVJA_03465 [Acidimicrobiia bacterium]